MRLEKGDGDPQRRTVDAIRAALEAAGVEFTDGETPGLRLKKRLPLSQDDVRSMLRTFGPSNPASSAEIRPRLIEARQQGGWPEDLAQDLDAALSDETKMGFPRQTAGSGG